MKKYLILLALAVGMIACTGQNEPEPGNNNQNDTTVVTPTDTTITTTDTICITWSGSSATIAGSHEGVTVTAENGYVTVNSTVKDISYLLSGTGQGQLTIYGTNRHQLILNNLALTCSDGPAINNQCKKSCFVLLQGTNTLTDGSTYATSTEDRKAAFFSEGQMIFSGSGSLTVTGNYKHAIASDDYIQFTESTGTLTLKAASDGIHANDALYFEGGTFQITAGSDGVQCDSIITIAGGNLTISATADGVQSDTANIIMSGGQLTITKAGDKGMTAFGDIRISGGTIRISSEYKCIKAGKKENNKVVSAGSILITGGDIQVVCNGTSSGGGWGGYSSDNSSPEAIEAKGTITISGGQVYAQSNDDAINAGGDMTISGGYVCAYSTGNDGLDANGNCYIKGGLVYAIGATSPEVAIDANTEKGYKLYVSGGTIIAVGDLEQGSSISGGTAKQTTSWATDTWYALYNGDSMVAAFKTPSKSSSGGGGRPGGGGSSSQKLVVYTSSTPALTSGVTVSGGTAYFNGMANIGGSVSGGSSVSLSSYSSSGGGRGY
ncbi:MAG: carbohydrate-binding domain-containing protein [Paludibacteraceae bacterium]|nr:carbohydrate-binding domain-containing protein [Paludibacteraceae bacterium]